jgi:hypothetical protein
MFLNENLLFGVDWQRATGAGAMKVQPPPASR